MTQRMSCVYAASPRSTDNFSPCSETELAEEQLVGFWMKMQDIIVLKSAINNITASA
jgi:hypothetical protein